MRRSIGVMLAALAALSNPARAQTAWGLGFAATLGSRWQIESGDVHFGRRPAHGPLGGYSVALRLGGFVDEGAIFFGNQGFVAALAVNARTPRLEIADIGDETNATGFGVDVTVEAAGYLASHSPLPQGSRWVGLSVLPGLRVGPRDGPQWAILVGPTAFVGQETDVRVLLAFRFEAPLARRESRP